MAVQRFAGFVYTGAGVAVSGATIDIFTRNTLTAAVTVPAAPSTNADGYWSATVAVEGRYDVRITNGTSVSWLKYDDELQIEGIETAILRVRNPADTFDYDIVPDAITADRQLNLPLLTGTDTLVSRNSGAAAYVLFIGDDANANMTTGLTINQGAADNEILALKSSDVAHSFTTQTEADTFGAFAKLGIDTGGLSIAGYSENWLAVELAGRGDAADKDDTDTTASRALIEVFAAESTGTTHQAVTLANIFGIRNFTTTRFLLKEDGELHLGNTTLVVLDAYDDVQIVRAMQRQSGIQGFQDSQWENPMYNYSWLREHRLAGDKDGNGEFLFPLQSRLHAYAGAIWQLGVHQYEINERLARMEQQNSELRRTLAAFKGG